MLLPYMLLVIGSFVGGLCGSRWLTLAAHDTVYVATQELIKSQHNSNADSPAKLGWLRSNVTYGHIHVEKTGGMTVNQMFAGRFERVCGNKGYS